MEQYQTSLCAVYSNGSFVNPECPQSDGYKYCLPQPGAQGLQGWDIRTMTWNECQSTYGNNPDLLQRCMTYAIAPTQEEALEQAGLTPPSDLEEQNKKITSIALLVIVLVVALLFLYYW